MSQAIINAYHRGLATKSLRRKGAMAAVGMGRAEVMHYLARGVVVACDNSPKSVTLSGDKEALERTLSVIGGGVFIRRLKVEVAYHSEHMQDVGDAYQQMLEEHYTAAATTIPYYSSVTGDLYPAGSHLEPCYWKRNLEHTVQFSASVGTLLRDLPHAVVFLEIGPHSTLQGPLREILDEKMMSQKPYISTMKRNENSASSLFRSLGELYLQGCRVSFSSVNPAGQEVVVHLPNYPWDHKLDYWAESRLSSAFRHQKHPRHEILGSRCLESSDQEPCWRNLLHAGKVPWLMDHVIGGDEIFPGAGYVAMMGEAIRQMTGQDAFTLRDVFFKSALVLDKSESTEMLLSMRPQRLRDDSDSPTWFEFSISSTRASTSLWTRNCTARGKAGEEPTLTKSSSALSKLPRRVNRSYFYNEVRRLGYQVGPHFQLLDNMTADPLVIVARATLSAHADDGGSHYSVHPTVIDGCFQPIIAAPAKGNVRILRNFCIPGSLQLVSVKTVLAVDLVVATSASATDTGTVTGSCTATTSSNQVAVLIEGLFASPRELGGSQKALDDISLGSRLEWLPDIDLLDAGKLVRGRGNKQRLFQAQLEIFFSMCLLQMANVLETFESSDDAFAALNDPDGNLCKFSAWIRKDKERIISVKAESLFPGMQGWALLPPEERNSQLNSMREKLDIFPQAIAMFNLGIALSDKDNLRALCKGHTSPAELLAKEEGLDHLYDLWNQRIDIDDLITLCAHKKPGLRVLEVGAGSGTLTKQVLQALHSKDGSHSRLYSLYTFSDISPAYSQAARAKFERYEAIEFRVLDISKNPSLQDFTSSTYDLIIAGKVVHNTPGLAQTLRNIHSLLGPEGRLVMVELMEPLQLRHVALTAGLFPGWWTGENDDRATSPLVSLHRWERELRDAGFFTTDSTVLDDEPGHAVSVLITATKVQTASWNKNVTFLYQKSKPDFGLKLSRIFEDNGFRVLWATLEQDSQDWSCDVVSLIDVEKPLLQDVSRADFTALVSYFARIRRSVLWLTGAAQIGCTSPHHGLFLGASRVIRSELHPNLCTFEVQRFDSVSTHAVLAVFQKMQSQLLLEPHQIDREFIHHEDVIYLCRCNWYPLVRELKTTVTEDCPKRLTIGQLGSLNTLHWSLNDLVEAAPWTDDLVEIEVRCVGINFKDLMIAMGMMGSTNSQLGQEASGVVTRVGSSVDGLEVGDHVVAVFSGCCATRIRLQKHKIFRMPDGMSFEEAATVPITFGTALLAIMEVGQMSKGQSILIHAASGGVGLAAIQVCKMLEVEVFCTVGSEAKVQYLVKNCGISPEQIFDSRSASFLPNVLSATGGRGVDLVLNSLAGDLLHASWQCVAKRGKLIEIGKRDLLGRGYLPLEPFLEGRSYHGLDFGAPIAGRPDFHAETMRKIFELYQQGHVTPLHHRVFPAHEVIDALCHMQQAKHIGKLVLKLPEDGSLPAVDTTSRNRSLSNESTYLFVGGLGGLGRAIATWAVERGARNFVFLSRSAGKSLDHQEFLRELEYQKCRAVAVAGKVADLDDVKRAIKAAPSPVAGVFHVAMTVEDSLLAEMPYEDWVSVQKVKVDGTWNLHVALEHAKLDFFLMLGSMSALVGWSGQANYASANAFQQSFVQFRRGLNLPCSLIDVGAMGQIGYMSERPALRDLMQRFNYYSVQEQELIDAIQISINHSKPDERDWTTLSDKLSMYSCLGQLGVGLRLADNAIKKAEGFDIRMAKLSLTQQEDEKEHDDNEDAELGAFLRSVAADPSTLGDPASLDLLTVAIGNVVGRMLNRPNIDPDARLSSLGLDSLVSVELNNWWRQTFKVESSATRLINAGSVGNLGKMAFQSLQGKHQTM